MKRSFITSLILISLVIIPIVLSAAIYTNKTDYNLLETVYITGTGFTPNVDTSIEIRDPTGQAVFVNQTKTDVNGNFTNTYIIPGDGNTGTYTIYASTISESAQNTFNVLADTENPQWSSLQHNPTVVTMLDDVKINVTWYDNINLDKILIWENSTGNWASHEVGG